MMAWKSSHWVRMRSMRESRKGGERIVSFTKVAVRLDIPPEQKATPISKFEREPCQRLCQGMPVIPLLSPVVVAVMARPSPKPATFS